MSEKACCTWTRKHAGRRKKKLRRRELNPNTNHYTSAEMPIRVGCHYGVHGISLGPGGRGGRVGGERIWDRLPGMIGWDDWMMQ